MLKQHAAEAKQREKELAHRLMVEEKAKSLTAVGKEQKNEDYMVSVTKRRRTPQA